MDVRPQHCYALIANPEKRVSQASERKTAGGKVIGFTSMVCHNPKNVIVAGHSSGAVYVFRRSKQAGRELVDGNSGEVDVVLPANNHDKLKDPKLCHKGPVNVLKIHPENSLLFSTSMDRTIKIWDIFHPEHMPTCVATVSGHGGSVTAIDFAANVGPSSGYMFTGSTDLSVIVWQNAEGREIMLYPFYVKLRVIEMKIWPNCLCFCSARMGQGDLYIGDGEGKITRMHLDSDTKSTKDFTVANWHSQTSSHELGVIQMRAEPHEGLLFSISNDTSVKLWEQATGMAKKSIKNENKNRFNGMCISTLHQEVFLVDDLGWLHIWSWISERLVFAEKVVPQASEPIFGIECNSDGTEIYVLRSQSVDSFFIVRGVSRVALKGHEAPLVGVGFLRPGKEEIVSGEEILYSCALDNTLRSWDPLTMQCSNVHRESGGSEMSSFGLIKKYRIALTGNDDGSLRVWSLDTGQHTITKGHTNTVSAITTGWTGATPDDPFGKHIVFTCGFDGDIISWEVTVQYKKTDFGDEQVKILPVGRTKAHKAEILCCAFIPADVHKADKYPHGLLVTAGNDLVIKKWVLSDRMDLESVGQFERVASDGYTVMLNGHDDSIGSMVVDANFLLTASDDCSINIWDVSGNFLVRSLTEADGGHAEPIKKLLMIENEGFLVSLSVDMCIKVWDYTRAAVLWEFQSEDEITCMIFDESKHALVCGTEDATVTSIDMPDMTWLNARRDELKARDEHAQSSLDTDS